MIIISRYLLLTGLPPKSSSRTVCCVVYNISRTLLVVARIGYFYISHASHFCCWAFICVYSVRHSMDKGLKEFTLSRSLIYLYPLV